MSGNQKTILGVLGLAILCALIALAAIVVYPYLDPPPDDTGGVALGTPPVVLITSPEMNEQIPVRQVVMVHAVARGKTKIARVELWIDGQLHTAQNSSLPGGTSPFPLVTPWQPASAGMHTLIARAFDVHDRQAQATIEVQATSADDRDNDGVPDGLDACPDEPGWQATGGCPDRDGDNVPDAQDACPDIPGPPENGGCPSPTAEDRDGDGIPDDADLCPDEPGMPTLDGCPMPSDRDGDEITDEDDACPDAPGPPETGGCPDRDGDGIVDGTDACPDEPGPPESGCPAPTDGDRDGDGVPDDIDRCPDEPGVRSTLGCPDRDGDTVADGEDACPDDFGPPENGGCPEDGGGPGGGPPGGGHDTDSDGDGIPDAEDSCPGTPGLPENEGCPDRDGDTVPDYRDMCPDEAGPPANLGCPESGAGDRDGDGVLDDVDRCPDEAGLPEHDGCPPPDEDDTDLPIPPDSGEVVWPDGPSTSVEFQVLSLQVSDDYDGVYCYPKLTAVPVERYAFEPLGGRQWSVPEDLGSRRIVVNTSETIVVQMMCGGDNVHLGEEGGWGVYWGMGSIDEDHPPSDWDGHVITARSFGGDGGRWFEAQYRLCSGSCDAAVFQPPLLLLVHGRESTLYWQWDGFTGQLAGYSVYVDGNRVMNVRSSEHVLFWGINAYEPTCGSRREFYVTAYGEDGRESPPSNVVVWEAATACPRVVRVTFDAITTYDLGDDEWWAEGESVGPIGGTFLAIGNTYEKLNFCGVDYPYWAWEHIRGYRLRHTWYYPIQSIFDQIRTWIVGSISTPYRVPNNNYVTVELDSEDDLTFGGYIYEADMSFGDHTDILFHDHLTIPAGEIRPGRYDIWDRNIKLTVLVDVLVGPEVGPNPDLTITNVDVHEANGRMRVHVFNNASDMPAPADITVHWMHVGTTEVVGSYTWENVQIPSGGKRILQTSEPAGPTGGMLFVLDPDEAIPDENRGNNTFETPVVIRFEFLEVGRMSACNDAVCWIFDCTGEFIFKLWVGYGPSADEIVWVGRNIRFPRENTLTACGHDICRSWESPAEDWIMEGNDRYVFELVIPADQNLYVAAEGEENDPAPERDDPLGRIFVEYTPDQNWGARPEEHEGWSSPEDISCDDLGCYKCRYGFHVDWLITRSR